MDDPTEAIDQELAIEHFHFLTTYAGEDPPEVSLIAEVKHSEADIRWMQELHFTREQLEQLVIMLHHIFHHDTTDLVWP